MWKVVVNFRGSFNLITILHVEQDFMSRVQHVQRGSHVVRSKKGHLNDSLPCLSMYDSVLVPFPFGRWQCWTMLYFSLKSQSRITSVCQTITMLVYCKFWNFREGFFFSRNFGCENKTLVKWWNQCRLLLYVNHALVARTFIVAKNREKRSNKKIVCSG